MRMIAMLCCRPWETLVAANAFFNDLQGTTGPPFQVLFSGDVYFLKLQMGDLRLFSNFGKGLKQYWSLKNTLAKNVDLSQVAYASECAFTSCLVVWIKTLLRFQRSCECAFMFCCIGSHCDWKGRHRPVQEQWSPGVDLWPTPSF